MTVTLPAFCTMPTVLPLLVIAVPAARLAEKVPLAVFWFWFWFTKGVGAGVVVPPMVPPVVPPLVGRSERLMEEPFLLKPEREEAATQPVTLPTVTFT